MATAAYSRWDRDVRPITPSQTIREMVGKMKLAYPLSAGLFSWYANEAHYQSDFPQDHTPFSVTGWPGTSPYPVVFATDIMHRPTLGVDCNKLFPYWLAEAKAGHTPWRKYIIWQAKLYDVRNDWRPQTNSGHFDHVHLSDRTDWVNRSIGDWDPTGENMPLTPEDAARVIASDVAPGDEKLSLGNAVWQTRKAALDILAKPPVTAAPVDIPALVAALDPLLRKIVREELDKTGLGTV
jgi:hypothetical protein